MARFAFRQRSMPRLLAAYAAITLLPVLALGAVLGITFNHEANQRGLAQGRSEARLIAQTAIEPELDARPLSTNMSLRERATLARLVMGAVRKEDVLRLRLRNLNGQVVFSDDGTGFHSGDDDEALEAARGITVSRLTHLNADKNDQAKIGVAAVEVYLPLHAGTPTRTVGVLEIYLPYAPIAAVVRAGLHELRMDLIGGLAALYLLLFGITLSASRGLRREVAVNAFLATHDTLTQLPNRELLRTQAGTASRRAGGREHPVTVAVVDLDRFKQINDTLGHSSGDRLLTELGLRLTGWIGEGDSVARLGGDEFGLVLHARAEPEQALHELREVIAGDIELSGLTLSVESSIGFVTVSEHERDIDVTLQHAEVAMYAAKAQHAGVVRYSPELEQYDADSLALVTELRHAMSNDQLLLHYQPQINPDSGEVVALEALLRWKHPTHGLVPPDRFLPLAEQTEAIESVTDWVIAAALRDVQHLRQIGFDLPVAVNVSARTIVREDFMSRVINALTDADVSPKQLTIEVTETALLTDQARATTVLTGLATAGVGVSLDDFGRGQTSLGYLSSLPVNELKIDRCFVTDMNENDAHAAIVRSIIDLGHNLGMQVVAEGIETRDVLSTLNSAGCDLAQGFHIAKPMPAEQLIAWLSARRAAALGRSAPTAVPVLPSV